MLCVRPDQAVEPLTLKLLDTVAAVAAELELPWFVTGAMARDLLLTGVFGLKSGRATRDVDLAVAVAAWERFAELKARLLVTGSFQEARGTAHRLYYSLAQGDRGYPLDLIPLGGIEGERSSIAWPPEGNPIMSVAGYEEAHATAVEVELIPGLVVRVASIPGLAVLKVLAWGDRGESDSKDAMDLGTILHQYFDAGNLERMYERELKILAAVGYDLELAGSRLLGRDVRAVATASTAEKVEAILAGHPDRLAIQVARAFPGADDALVKAERLLEQFRLGLRGE